MQSNKLSTPRLETDALGISQERRCPLVSIVQDEKELSSTYGKEKLPKSFEEMQRHGIRIINYTTNEV